MSQLQAIQSCRSFEERMEIRSRLERKNSSRIPLQVTWTQFMYSKAKNHFVAMIGEFIGTFLFLFFAFAGVEVTNLRSPSDTGTDPLVLLYVSFAFGFSLIVNAWVFFRISGGLFNPAVTLALTILGDVTWIRGLLLTIVQCGAACFSAYVVSVIFPTPFTVATTLAPNTTRTQGFFIETICTTELVFAIIMLAKEKHRGTFLAPVGIGLALFIGEMAAVGFTGGSLNPARSLGPAAVSRTFTKDHWIYWIGPGLGSVLAVIFYKLFKVLEYELVVPGQDGDLENDPTRNSSHSLARIIEQRQAEIEELRLIQSSGGFGSTARLSKGSHDSGMNGGARETTSQEDKVIDLEAGRTHSQGV